MGVSLVLKAHARLSLKPQGAPVNRGGRECSSSPAFFHRTRHVLIHIHVQFYARALSSDFKFHLPGLGGRTLDRRGYFELIFDQLLPAFPDLSYNANFLTTTGLDDCAHVEIQARPCAYDSACQHRVKWLLMPHFSPARSLAMQVTGTHTGAPLHHSDGLHFRHLGGECHCPLSSSAFASVTWPS